MTGTLFDESRQTTEPAVEESIADQVMALLGRPKNLYRVIVRRLWADNYRVNVFCMVDTEDDRDRIRITDSFFVTQTAEGLRSTPTIIRRY